MERDLESAPGTPSHERDSSFSDLLGDTSIRQPLVKILKAQRELLAKYEAWASFQSQRSDGFGFVNVPPEVLGQVKDSFMRRKQAIRSPKAAARPRHTTGGPDIPEPSGSQSSSPPRIEREEERDGDDGDSDAHSGDGDGDGDDPTTPSTWSRSSKPGSRPPSVEREEPMQPFITQLPEESSPPEPTIVTSPPKPPKLPPLPAFPRSSQEPEDELEVQVPAALAYNPEPINKSALPMLATPPSAQVVPCTFEQSTASTGTSGKIGPQPKSHARKHIYKRVPELYRGPKQSAPPSHLNTNMAALSRKIDIESSLSADNTSSSIVPSTRNDHVTEGEQRTTAWDVRPGQIPAGVANPSPNNLQSPLVSRRPSPVHVPTSPSLAIRSPQPPTPAAHHAVPHSAALKSWEAPFVHYTITYPSYNGTIQDFVTACIYIQLQYRRIRTSLYDDFIRAWVEGYLPYVKDCDEAQPPRKALRAIEWYNEIDDDPLFTSRVVTRQNLQSILNFYPKELEMAQSSLSIASRQRTSEYEASSRHIQPYSSRSIHIPSSSPTHAQRSKGREPIRKSVEEVEPNARHPKPSPILKPKMPALTAGQYIPVHKSFNGIETRPARSEGLARSFSESTTHRKRLAPNELGSEGAKRISLGLTSGARSGMPFDSGGAGGHRSLNQSKNTARSSVVPESTPRRKSAKAAEDPEKRERRLAKHFKKMMAGRASIASSAAPSNTPTSGQKH
ncbi:hypothetical protein F5X97DRAFT_300036 [Nemania serpens]|nr:hypothetical protein F5X97DRAFT_300036 [Nemania serpens]